MTLSESQKKFLRGRGHKLKPVIMVGPKGLSESLLEEFDSTIRHHELIKVRGQRGDRGIRDEIISGLCSKSAASLIAKIGNVALIYRRNDKDTKIRLPA